MSSTTARALCVVLGGGLGAYLRYGVQNWTLGRWGIAFPYGTLLVNISGAFCIGLLMTVMLKHLHISAEWRLFAVTGVLGGYTTFSALVWEAYSLFTAGQLLSGMLYVTVSFLGGAIALVAGVLLAHFL